MQTLDLLSNLQHRISQHKHSCSSVVTTMLASSIWERFLTTDKWPRPRIGCHPQHQALTTQTDKTEEAAQRLKLLLPCPFLLALPLLYRTRCREQWLDTCDPHAVINYKCERWMVKNFFTQRSKHTLPGNRSPFRQLSPNSDGKTQHWQAASALYKHKPAAT